MSPSQRTFSSVAMELARENSCRRPSTEDPKVARSARSALDLSKEAKIRVRGGGAGAVRQKQDHAQSPIFYYKTRILHV